MLGDVFFVFLFAELLHNCCMFGAAANSFSFFPLAFSEFVQKQGWFGVLSAQRIVQLLEEAFDRTRL